MTLPVVQTLQSPRQTRYEANLWRHMGLLAELPADYQQLEASAVDRRIKLASGRLATIS